MMPAEGDAGGMDRRIVLELVLICGYRPPQKPSFDAVKVNGPAYADRSYTLTVFDDARDTDAHPRTAVNFIRRRK